MILLISDSSISVVLVSRIILRSRRFIHTMDHHTGSEEEFTGPLEFTTIVQPYSEQDVQGISSSVA